jgi:hypothetical protein
MLEGFPLSLAAGPQGKRVALILLSSFDGYSHFKIAIYSDH